MQFVKQKDSLKVLNLDETLGCDTIVKRHGNLLPSSCRAVLAGASSSGKTNVIVSLLIHPNGLRFKNVYIYSRSLFQPKYQFLKRVIEPIKGMGYYEFNENDEVICPSVVKPDSVFIFDDIVCDKQDKIKQYYSMGRHKNVDSFYLSQTYAKIPKHLIRDNVNLVILFKQDELNLKHVFEDHVSPDLNFQQFKDVCASCWKEGAFEFLVINKECPLNAGRYRKGFDCYINF